MTYKTIKYNSPEYEAMIGLRNDILRKPIGLSLTDEDKLNESNDIFITGWDSNLIIGCCILTKQSLSEVRLRQMAVHDKYQRKGIGKEILEFAENIAKKNGFSKITLHARKTAANFYLKFAYKISGDEFMEVGMPHVMMEKIISI